IAAASASLASNRAGIGIPSTMATILPTCSFSARPVPVTACLMTLGAKLRTAIRAWAAARMATPRAWPRTRAERAFFAWKTSSRATIWGRCRRSSRARPSCRAQSRSSIAPPSPSSRTPWARWRTVVPPASSTTPKPQYLEPGSIPRTRTRTCLLAWTGALDARLDRCHLVVGDLEIGVDVLDVVVLLEVLDQPHHLLCDLSGDLHGGLRQVRHLRRSHRDLALKRLVHVDERRRVGPDLESSIAVGDHVLGAGFQGKLHHLVLAAPLLH